MLKSLKLMQEENKDLSIEWLNYLYNTSEKNFNINNVKSLKEINNHSVFILCGRNLKMERCS